MVKPLKYKTLIDTQNLNCDCPPLNCQEKSNIIAFRWALEPIENQLNLIPNLIYDKVKGAPPRKNSTDDKVCENCALSFFNDRDKAFKAFNSLPPRGKTLIGYTHIIEGTITDIDGLRDDPNKGHFILFEYEGVELKEKFKVIGVLNA